MNTQSTTAAGDVPASGTVPPRNAYGRPYAVILAELDEIRFGDVLLDTLTGPLVVDELVRRRRTPIAEFAEHRPKPGAQRDLLLPVEMTERRHVIDHSHTQLRIARDVDTFGPRRGHHTRVRTHNPRKVGCYTHVDGWLAECSCGWPGETPQIRGSKQSARRAWLEHKADEVTSEVCDRHGGYVLVSAAEQEHQLPPIPWEFAHNGVAVARLDALDPQRALEVAHAWAAALGVEVARDSLADVTAVHVAATLPRSGGRVLVSIDGYFDPPDGV